MVSIKMLSIKLLWAVEIFFGEEVFVEVGRCDVAFGGTACTGLCGQEISGKLITCVRIGMCGQKIDDVRTYTR
jgi:hypothetical protein